MRRSKKLVQFWQEQLRLAFIKQEKVYNELQRYLRWQTRGSFFFHGGGIFLCGRKFGKHDKAKLINLQRKIKQLKSSKISYFLERIAAGD